MTERSVLALRRHAAAGSQPGDADALHASRPCVRSARRGSALVSGSLIATGADSGPGAAQDGAPVGGTATLYYHAAAGPLPRGAGALQLKAGLNAWADLLRADLAPVPELPGWWAADVAPGEARAPRSSPCCLD